MGFRLYRRIGIVPGLRINLSRSGPSLTVGGGGFHYTVGPTGTRTSLGVPGTGLYYTKHHAWRTASPPAPVLPAGGASPGAPPSGSQTMRSVLVAPLNILMALLTLAMFLCGVAAVAGVMVVIVGVVAVIAGWPHGVGVALVVVVTLLALVGGLAVGSHGASRDRSA
ncbi:MAG TPA: DUF4236 domain-containing protein [Chloroflexota bacterium]|nr:DUF4236 domain-containing protein [Chloroflexota bacterium]